jgi:Retinal pigment epithelial membrane protein
MRPNPASQAHRLPGPGHDHLSDLSTEFGTIHNGFGGRPYRYSYAATNEPGWFTFNGLVKHDTLTGVAERYQFEPGVLQRGRRGAHVMVMMNWGDKWFRAPEGPATMLTHTSCGGEFRPVLHCSVCGLELHGSQIQVGGDPPKAADPR